MAYVSKRLAAICLLVMAIAGSHDLLAWESSSPAPLTTMKQVNDHWIDRHPDPGNARWNRAVYFMGNMAIHRASGAQRYLDRSLRWAADNDWETHNYDPSSPTTNADNQACGQTYIELYQIDPVPSRLTVIKESVDIQVGRSKVDDWYWIDAIYMSAPVFSKLGEVYQDGAYAEKLFALYDDTKTRRGLYDPQAGLWYRDDAFVYPDFQTPNGKKSFWSRGNGWVIASLPRILAHLPSDSPHRGEYVSMLQTMAAALKTVQRPDGFWNVSLHDPDDYPGPETSGTALFAYAMAWGINNGYLDPDTYVPVVIRAWDAMVSQAVHPDGKLGYVQGPGKRPSSAQPVTYDSTEDFGVGAFLLAGSEIRKIAGIDFVPPPPISIRVQ